MQTRILTGTALEVEREIQELEESYYVNICGVSATDNTTTVVIQISPIPQ